MIKGITLLFVALFCNYKTIHAQHHRFRFSTGGAVNTNNFKWSIAGNLRGESPNILSELKFDKITSLGVFLDGVYTPIKILEIHGSYQKNGTVSGTVVDTDFNGDNRTDPVYNEHFSSNKGHLESFSAGVVINYLTRKKYALKAGICYTNTTQNYYLLNPDMAKLRTTYRAKWVGPGLSAGGEYKINKSFSADVVFTFCFITYKAVADWNLRRDFEHPVSFMQNANGHIVDGQLGLSYRLNAYSKLMVNGAVGRLVTKKGVDIAYLTNNTQPATQFNGAYRNYCEIRMGIAINF